MTTQKPDLNSVVAKSNDLIVQMAKFGLSELRLIAYCLAHYDSRDKINNLLVARVDDLLELFPINEKSAYRVVRQVMIGIGKKPLEVKVGKRHKYRNWFSGFDYVEGSGEFEFMINPDVQPYLLELKGNFTRYRLSDVYQFKSATTWKLYELLKKWVMARVWEVTLDELRPLLGVAGKYPRWSDFQVRIIAPATAEINETSDIKVEYTKVKRGRSIIGLSFSIRPTKKEDKDVIDVVTDRQKLVKTLVENGVNQKVAKQYATQADHEGKAQLIIDKLPAMVKRAKGGSVQKYLLGAITQELKQQSLFGDNYAHKNRLFKEALACWEKRDKQCHRKTNTKEICAMCGEINKT